MSLGEREGEGGGGRGGREGGRERENITIHVEMFLENSYSIKWMFFRILKAPIRPSTVSYGTIKK